MNRRLFIDHGLKSSIGLFWQRKLAVNESMIAVRRIPKTDTHVHLFDLQDLKYPWLENAPKINRTYTLNDFREASKRSNIGKILFMESGAAPEFAVREARWVAQLAKDEPQIKGIIAQQDLSHDLGNSSAFSELQKIDILRGIRSKFAPDSPHYLDNLQALPALDLTCDLLLAATQLDTAAHIVAQCPDTRFILDHLGNPDIRNGDINVWKEGIGILARQPNVCCKISGIITRIGEDWTLDRIRPYVMHVFQEFGVDRLVYGGDWPVVLLADSYRSWSRAFEKLTLDFSEDDLTKIYHKNADRIYKL